VPADYDAIKQENIRRYGYDPVVFELLGRIYTERTHFIFELLQNAEDALATTVRFDLYQDRLEFLHDGRLFNPDDVVGVCGVGKGTKADDLTKIGQFGVGFKSVYAYTCCPTIHSGDEHFRIEHYVRPTAVAPHQAGKPWTTVFIFPFNRHDVPAHQAGPEILQRLASLSARILLFLRHIDSIAWHHSGGTSGAYERNELKRIGDGCLIEVEESMGASVCTEQWLTYDRAVRPPSGGADLRVEVAYRIVEDALTQAPTVTTADRTQLVVSFPTEKETHLGFLIQGPYQTTPARDNIPVDVDWNRHLIAETATLIADTLPQLRDAGLVNVNLLEVLPIDVSNFPVGSMFRPLYDRVRVALSSERLLPTDGSHVFAHEAKLARALGLIDLFTSRQLAILFKQPGRVYWLNRQITFGGTQTLYRYLAGHRSSATGPWIIEPLIADLVIDSEAIVRNLDHAVLHQQSDEWFIRLYAFLSDQRALWPIVKRRPILRLENRQLQAPFDGSGQPLAYLPGPIAAPVNTVARSITNHPDALAFLRQLGLTEPDLTTQIVEILLPKYTLSSFHDISEAEHEKDLRLICETLNQIPPVARSRLVAHLKQTPFLRAKNALSREGAYREPRDIYRRTADLEMYWKGNHEGWLIDEEVHLPDALLDELGVRRTIQVIAAAPGLNQHITLHADRGKHERGLNGFDPACRAVGLGHALKHISIDKARAIWSELLLPNRHLIRGTIESSTKQSYENAERKQQLSVFGKQLVDTAWLPAQSGGFHRPADLSPEDLPPGFQLHDELASALGMQIADLEAAVKVTGLPISVLQLMRSHQDDFERFAEELAEELKERIHRTVRDKVENEDASPSFVEALQEEFAHPGATRLNQEAEVRDDAVRNVALRRERTGAEIEIAKQAGPLKQHFSRVPSSHWNGKDSATRIFLQQQYGGRCQICDTTFPKANGEPYFEGLYLVSRIIAAWHDRPGNVLSLCPTCCAKMQFGSVEASDLIAQIQSRCLSAEGGSNPLWLRVTLLGQDTTIRFTERHLLDLQEMVKASM